MATWSVASPVVVVLDGQEVVLGPLEAALVRAVLGAAARCRQQRGYQIHLHVGKSVVCQVLMHVGDVPYAAD